MTKLNEKQIAAYEAKGFNRWTKGNFDRLYIDANAYGCDFEYYGTGNIRSCHFQGERVSNAEGYRFKSTKVFIDVNTGELSVTTKTDYEDEIREAVEAIMAEVEQETAEPEIEDEPEAEEETVEEETETTTEPTTETTERYWFGKYDPDAEAKAVYDKGFEFPQDGTDAEYVRRVTYRTIGNGYINLELDPWQLAESIIGAADLMLADGTSVYEVSKAIRRHIETTAVLYDVY